MRRLLGVLLVAFLVACGSGGSSGGGASAGGASPAKPSGGSVDAQPGQAISAALQAAGREGTLELYGPSSLDRAGAAPLVEAFNRKYGLNMEFNYTPSGSMTRDAARVITEITAGQQPTWDLM